MTRDEAREKLLSVVEQIPALPAVHREMTAAIETLYEGPNLEELIAQRVAQHADGTPVETGDEGTIPEGNP